MYIILFRFSVCDRWSCVSSTFETLEEAIEHEVQHMSRMHTIIREVPPTQFADDREALDVLDKYGIKYPKGMIQEIDRTKFPSIVYKACNYLRSEWDYG